MKITNRKGVCSAWVEAVEVDDYHNPGWQSVTGIINPPQITLLKQRHDAELTADVCDMAWSVAGKAVHKLLESTKGNGAIIEQRILIPVLGKTVGAQPDRVEPMGDGFYWLQDFKFSNVWAWRHADAKFEWEAQTNIYAYGLHLMGIEVKKITIEMLIKDFSWTDQEIERAKGIPYPDDVFEVVPIPIWSWDKTKKFLEQRVKLYKACESLPDNKLPPCTEQDRWVRDSKWKVFTSPWAPGKKSRKNCNTEAEAIAYSRKCKGQTEVRFVPGKQTRCERYCPVRLFCQQYNYELNPAF